MKKSYLLVLIMCLFFVGFSSCDSFKKAQGNSQTSTGGLDPITGKKTKKKKKKDQGKADTTVDAKMDTIQWSTSATAAPPISSNGVDYSEIDKEVEITLENPEPEPETNPNTEIYSSYKAAVLLPFLSDKFNTANGKVYEKSKLAIGIYGGMKMAFQQLEKEGIRMEVSVLDTKGSLSTVNSLLNRTELKESQLIIGPVRSENLKSVARFANQNKIPLVSPVSPSKVISSDNPYYLQVSPSLETHCQAITRHIRQQYSADQVVLITRDKDVEKRRMQYFQEANHTFDGNRTGTRFKEYVISEISADYSNIDVRQYMHPNKKTVFVIPSWSNESFINTLLRIIRISKSPQGVVVYGMPKWMEYEKISYDYYEDLNVHISNDTYIDPNSTEVQSFKTNYFNIYGEAPSEHAFLGFDLMLYMGRMLHQKGTQFQQTIDQSPAQYMHTKFEFQPISQNVQTTGDENFSINQYENKHVNILEFKDFYFQRADFR